MSKRKNNTKKKKMSKMNNKTKKNIIKNCMDTFVKKKTEYWTSDIDEQIKHLDKKKNLTKEEEKLYSKLKKQKTIEIKRYNKLYKLYNCNIHCKNTLLEPGPPNKIPNSMKKKEYHNDKKLIKFYSDVRKNIFEGKTNVLIDSFHENTPDKIKKELIKEGAISQCVPMG